MRPPRHPGAPFQLTRPGPAHVLRWCAAAAVAAATTGLAAVLGLGTGLLVPLAAVGLLVATGALVPEPEVVAHVDRDGIHLGTGAGLPLLRWEDVRSVEVGAVGATHLLVVHGHDGPLARVAAQESPPATVLRLQAAKVAALVPGWVRIEPRTQLVVRGWVDRGPVPRPDLAT